MDHGQSNSVKKCKIRGSRVPLHRIV